MTYPSPAPGSPALSPRRRPWLALLAFVPAIAASLLQLGCYNANARTQNGGGGGRSSPTLDGSHWIRHSVGTGSTVELPYQPRVEQERGRLPDGTRVDSRTASLMFADVGFMILVTDFEGGTPGDPLDLLDGMLEDFLDEIEGMEVVSGDAVWRQGHPGTALDLRNETNGRRLLVQQYVGRSRAYLFAYWVDQAKAPQYAATEQHYFQSIALDAGDAPSPAGDGVLDFTRFQWIYPPEAGIAAEMPGAARRDDGSVRFGDQSYDTYDYSTRSTDGTTAMTIRWIGFGTQHPDDVLPTLQTLAAAGGGTLRGVRPTQRYGYGGQSYVVETATTVRYVVDLVTNAGVIELVHQVPRGSEAAQADQRRRFFNSLRIL